MVQTSEEKYVLIHCVRITGGRVRSVLIQSGEFDSVVAARAKAPTMVYHGAEPIVSSWYEIMTHSLYDSKRMAEYAQQAEDRYLEKRGSNP